MNKKNYLLGLYILILPVLLFLNTSNLRQVNIKSIIFILISILIIFFLIITLYKIYSKIFNVKVNDKIFPGLCFIFYLQFFYSEIKEVYKTNLLGSGYISLIFLSIISILTIILWSKYFKFLNRFSMMFSVILTLFFIYNFYIYSSISSNNKIYNIKKENELSSVNKNQSFNNVYFILFDAMMPIEEFVKHENLNVENVIAGFDQSYKYIKGSISNYDNTRLSLTSTFTNSYFLDDKSSKFKNYDNFYPYFLYNKKKTNQLSLIRLLKKNKVDFIWFGNHLFPCRSVIGIICVTSSSIETNLVNEVKIFYAKTPIITILDRLTRPLIKRIPSDDMLEYIKNNKKKNNFFFIHNMLPNGPHLHHANCNKSEKKLTYNDSYKCSLKKIKEITHTISKYDKEAIVLITADHGANSEFLYENTLGMSKLSEINDPTITFYDPRIFTLIKFPKECSNKTPDIFHSLNNIRYLLNCSYSEKLSYLPYYFYRSYSAKTPNFGKLVDHTKYVQKYLSKLKQN